MRGSHIITILLIALSVVSTPTVAQTFDNPNDVISAYFNAMSTNADSSRSALIASLLVEGGQMNATVHSSPYRPFQKLGTYQAFLNASKDFYTSHNVSYDEAERSIDYYEDIAMVNSLVFQTIVDKKDTTVVYEQWMWFSFDMAYTENRWYITSVSWVNAFDGQLIDDAMLQDTLWHTPQR